MQTSWLFRTVLKNTKNNKDKHTSKQISNVDNIGRGMYPSFSHRDEDKFLKNNYSFTVDSYSGDRSPMRISVNGVLFEILVVSDAMENVIHSNEYKRL